MVRRKNDSDIETKYTELDRFSLQAFCFLTVAEIFAWGSRAGTNTSGTSSAKVFLRGETFFQPSFGKSTRKCRSTEQESSDLSFHLLYQQWAVFPRSRKPSSPPFLNRAIPDTGVLASESYNLSVT